MAEKANNIDLMREKLSGTSTRYQNMSKYGVFEKVEFTGDSAVDFN
jgi:hypothetical protein